jgi:hypothetical protein
LAVAALLGAAVLWASSDVPDGPPSQWSSHDVYEILHKSPWSRTVKVGHSEKGMDTDNGPVAGSAPSNPGTAGRMGGMGGMGGRRGMGGGGYGGAGASGGSSGTSTSTHSSTAEVMIQWQSALPVRLAAAKEAGQDLNTVASQPSNEYVIGVVGLPLVDVGGRAASMDSAPTTDQDEAERIEKRLQSSTSLAWSGGEPEAPSSVELDQGKDGRMVFHFPKTDHPITEKDKSAKFRIATNGTKIQRIFELKEMEYQGKLEL